MKPCASSSRSCARPTRNVDDALPEVKQFVRYERVPRGRAGDHPRRQDSRSSKAATRSLLDDVRHVAAPALTTG